MYNVQIDRKDIWNPSFYKDFLGYESLVPWWQQYEDQFQNKWPDIDHYNQWFQKFATINHLSSEYHVSFIPQSAQAVYEQDVYLRKNVCTRINNWHDFFNNVTWILYPKTKWAIIQRSTQENINKPPQQVRTKRQNLLAHFDECGMVLCSAEPDLFNYVKTFSWKNFFLEPDLVLRAWPLIFGHGLFEKANKPYIGMTGKVIFLQVEPMFFDLSIEQRLSFIDDQLSAWILHADFPDDPKALHPFPMLGWPKWHAQNTDPAFYDNRNYFRPMPVLQRR